MAEQIVDQAGMTRALMTDLVVGNVAQLLQEARSGDCPSAAHANWCIREAFRTLHRYAGVATPDQLTLVLGDIAILFDDHALERIVAQERADEERKRAA